VISTKVKKFDMCGFIFSKDKEGALFNEAFNELTFRGPDSDKSISIGGFNLGHKRLKILDLSDAGAQPMFSHSRKHVILYNGEVYNFQELALKHGIRLHSHCDTELIVELYEKIGLGMLPELNGMFSFVILNLETREFVVVRDRLGIKPLFYSFHRGEVIFCSEVSPIKKLLGGTTIDEVGVRQYQKLRTFFRGHTIWNEIKMFPSGSIYKSSTGRFEKYWELSLEEQEAPNDDELFQLVKSAVDYRTISDVPVGCFLSGGLDSSIIAALMKRVETWGVGCSEQNEFEWSQQVADNLSMPHNQILVDSGQYRGTMEEMIRVRQEPLSVPNEVLIYLMSRAAKSKNTVVLGGEGADELFFGYDRIFRWANDNQWDLRDFDTHYSYRKGGDLEVLDYVMEPYRVSSSSALKTVAKFFQLGHLHGLLRRVDFASMLASVEARVPFVDHRLVERIAGVSFNYRMHDGLVKAPLKRVFRPLVPLGIIERKKVGFPVDLGNMLSIPGAGYEEFLNLNLEILEN